MQIKCLGGFREVGRNAVLIDGKEKILLDYGVKVEASELPKNPGKVDTILLGHSHLDHCGSIPSLYKKSKPKFYSTAPSFDLTRLLIKDSLKIARLEKKPIHFNRSDIGEMERSQQRITYGQQFETKNSTVDVYDAGHIPGSSMFVVNTEGKRILYTSDFKLTSTRLLNGAKIDAKDIDVLIMESTYAAKDHPNRKETEQKLIQYIKETIANEGIALIPVFAVGRAAEVLMILDTFKRDFPIYLDGMAKTATEIALKYPEFIKDAKKLKKALQDVEFIHKPEMRRKIVKNPCAIVTTSGMLSGGPIVRYMKYLYSSADCSLVFTGFQVPKTSGRYLLDTGRFVTEDLDFKVKMNIYHLDFSAHVGRKGLFDFVHKINPGKVICIHGDNCGRFAKELKSRGFDAVAPNMGDVVKI